MPPFTSPNEAHPQGESASPEPAPAPGDDAEPLTVDTPGGRFRAQFTPDLPVSALGALVFFAQHLAATGAFDALIADTPPCYASNRAHSPRDVLGTLLLGMLSGHYRYAHLAALRGDGIAPRLLGLDAIRQRGLRAPGPAANRRQRRPGRVAPPPRPNMACVLDAKWVLDIDTTIKPIYGRQEGSTHGYNPHKLGRPGHAYHTCWIASVRLCLDVGVYPGHQAAAGHGWQGAEGRLRLQGWSRTRRVIVLRRRLNDQKHPRARRRLAREQARHGLFLSIPDAAARELIICEHRILVTNPPYEILTLATLYRERGDAENPFDELKNQWSWSGFTTHDLRSCQHAARLAALVYNWWTLYHRLLQPGQHHEAVSTRPRLLFGAARQTEHAGQRRLDVRLSHAEAPRLQEIISRWPSGCRACYAVRSSGPHRNAGAKSPSAYCRKTSPLQARSHRQRPR